MLSAEMGRDAGRRGRKEGYGGEPHDGCSQCSAWLASIRESLVGADRKGSGFKFFSVRAVRFRLARHCGQSSAVNGLPASSVPHCACRDMKDRRVP